MRIERAVLREVPLTLETPFESSAGVVAERHALILTLHGEGLQGWSECVAPSFPNYTYEAKDLAWLVLTGWLLPEVVGRDLAEPADVLRLMSGVRGHEMAKATVEMAVWDLVARARDVSLAESLGGEALAVDVGVSLGMMPTAKLVETIDAYLGQGYARVKVKIGPGRDLDVLGALRSRFPDLDLWADANSSYTIEDAERLRGLDALGLGLLEEPLTPGDLLRSAELQDLIETPICLDESIRSATDLELALELGSCRIVNLKPGRVGGLSPSLGVYRLAMEAGVPVWCGGMLETGIGRAHNVALASLAGFALPGDLSASRRYWKQDIVWPEFEVVDGRMAVPRGPGLGVEIDVARIERLALRVAEFD